MRADCEPCQAGDYRVDLDTCAPCPEGSFSPVPLGSGAVTCSLCAAGYYQSDEGQTSCTDVCADGTFSLAGASTCFTSFTSEALRVAVTAWCDGDTETFGHISKWPTSGVEDMSYLFSKVGYDDAGIYHTEGVYCKSYDTFNEDISAWDGAFWILYVSPPLVFSFFFFFLLELYRDVKTTAAKKRCNVPVFCLPHNLISLSLNLQCRALPIWIPCSTAPPPSIVTLGAGRLQNWSVRRACSDPPLHSTATFFLT